MTLPQSGRLGARPGVLLFRVADIIAFGEPAQTSARRVGVMADDAMARMRTRLRLCLWSGTHWGIWSLTALVT